MTPSQVIEGTPTEILDHLKTLDSTKRLTLIVPSESESEQADTPKNLHSATPEERALALDEIAEMNRDLPILPPEAFSRENLYEERF